jgi:hypothetical protein
MLTVLTKTRLVNIENYGALHDITFCIPLVYALYYVRNGYVTDRGQSADRLWMLYHAPALKMSLQIEIGSVKK